MSQVAPGIDRLLRLEQLVPLCASIRQGMEYGAALGQAAGEVRKAAAVAARLESLEPALRALQGTQLLPLNDLSPDFEKLEAAGRNLKLCVNTETLKDVRFSVKDIQEAVQRLEALVSKAWAARVHAEFSPLERLGTVLAGITDTKAAGVALQKWATQALGLSVNGVPTDVSIKRFSEAQAELADRLKTLGELGIDAEVRKFLIEIAGERATLASMTPEVLEWLRTKKAQSRFRVKLI